MAVGGDKPAAAPKPPGAFDISALDTSVDPCVNLPVRVRRLAQGQPDPARPDPVGPLGARSRPRRETARTSHRILEAAKDPAAKRSPIEARVGDYYAACMDEAGIETRGLQPLDPILGRVDAVQSKADFFRLLGENEGMALPTLFRFGSAPDLHDSTRTIASVGQGGLSLPDRSTT